MKKAAKAMKKLLTLILAISMVMTTVPQTGMQVLAAEPEVEINSGNPTDEFVDEAEILDNEDETLGGGITDGENESENLTEENQNPSVSDTDPLDEETENGEVEEVIPEDEADDDSISLYSSESDFTISNAGVITKYSGTDKDVVIPDAINGTTVNGIGYQAFWNNTTIQSVIFSNNITSIDTSAFAGCTALQTVVLNDGLTTIGNQAFQKCSSLKDITLPEGLEAIGSDAFNQAALGERLDTGAIQTGTLEIPGSVKSIGSGAFKGCTYLGEVIFINGTNEELALNCNVNGVFGDCLNLKRVELPDRLKKTGDDTFRGCSSLEEVVFGSGLTSIERRVFSGCGSLKNVEFPNTLEEIGDEAFSKCSSLNCMELPEGLKTIGYNAFYQTAMGEKKSTGEVIYGSLTFPSTLQSIGGGAFYDCAYLKEVVFDEDLSVNAVLEINYGTYGTFYSCSNLKTVILPDRLKKIQSSTFNNCTALEEVTLGKNLIEIENAAFYGCSSLKCVELPEGLMTIGYNAFYKTAMGEKKSTGEIVTGSLKIPSTVQTIGTSAFAYCEYLGEVIFENGDTVVLSLGNPSGGAFKYCPNLKTVILPDRLEDTGASTFMDCTSLEKVVCGEKLKTIGNSAFYGCTALKDVTLNQRLETIQSSAFSQCSSLKCLELPEGLVTIGASAFYKAALGEKKSTGEIITGSLTIPSTVQDIGSSAFSFSEYLGEVIFANGETVVLTIGSGAFTYCPNLQKVLFPNRLSKLDFGMFSNSKNLNMLYIPASVTTISGSYSEYFYSTELVIYGDQGSEAENFAKKNGIPFKLKKDLDIYVKGLSLSPTKIERALSEEELSKVTVQLHATISPSTALNKAVTYKVTDQTDGVQVATVSDTGVITLTGYGEATITVTAVDTEVDTFSATCKVIVLRQWTEEEKEEARQKLYELNQKYDTTQGSPSQFTLITNINTNLQNDFPLTTGTEDFTAKWRQPYTVQSGTNSTYDIDLHKDGYQDAVLKGMTITGIQIEGIAIDGNNTINIKAGADGQKRLTSRILVKGYEETQSEALLNQLEESSVLDYEITWKSAKPANVTVAQVGGSQGKEADISGLKQSKGNTVTVELALKDKSGATSKTAANKGITWFSVEIKADVLTVDVVNGIGVTVTDSAGKTVELSSLRELTEKEIGSTYYLSATAYKDDSESSPVNDCQFTWKSSDTKVADVKTQTDGVVLTVKAKGSATISITAAKNGGYTDSFKVTVKDSEPRLENSNVILNLNLKDPTGMITIRPSDGYLIQDDKLELVTVAEGSPQFTIEKVSGSGTESESDSAPASDDTIEYRIGIRAESQKDLKTGKYKVTLKVVTGTSADPHPHELPLTIQVNKQMPKVTVTQTAIDLYKQNGTGTLEIVADAAIKSIEYTPKVTNSVHLKKQGEAKISDDKLSGSLDYELSEKNSSTYTKANAKGTLTVTFEGYKEGTEYSYRKDITLKTNKTLPKFTTAGITLYPEAGVDSAKVRITENATGQVLTAATGYQVDLDGTAPENYTVTNLKADQLPAVTITNKAKAKALKFTIRNDQWIDGIKTTVSYKVKIGKTPALSFSNAKITLNTKFPLYTREQYKPVEIDPYIAGFEEDIAIVGLEEIKGKDAKSTTVYNRGNGALLLTFGDGKIKAGIADASAFSGTQKYTYLVTVMTSVGISVTGTLTVSVTTAAASVNLKASGSIDLADRAGDKSAVVYKISAKNLTDDIDSVELGGSYANCFKLTYENGAATLRAKENRELKIKTKYLLSIKVNYASGAELIKEVTITPKQTSPKFTANVKKVTLFESAPGASYGQKIVFNGKTEADTDKIEKIELVSGQNAFQYIYRGDKSGEIGSGILYVTEEASAKTNKAYTLKFAVTLKDAAVNAAPVYVTVQVKYNK